MKNQSTEELLKLAFFLCANLNLLPKEGKFFTNNYLLPGDLPISLSLCILCSHSLWLPISLKISAKLKWAHEPSCAIVFSTAPFSISSNGGRIPQAKRNPCHTGAQAGARHLGRSWCSLFWWVTASKTKTKCFSRSQKGNSYLFSSVLEFAFRKT